MDKTYNPKQIEGAIYQKWLDTQAFAADHSEQATTSDQSRFCIVLPPPNVTGSLHMGHAFQQTLIDILIRAHRMHGENVHWQIGTDHAGIATQMVIENQLHQEGKTRYDIGREDFIKRVWQWKEESGGTILKQMHRLGASADWSLERFTMDEGLSNAVQKAFITLYNDGFIYRGKRLVNWDPHFKTAVSDLEVIHSEEQGFLYHICYPLANGNGSVTIATTRPETMLGDVAVAVHPEDERYQQLIGKTIRLPLTDREIPIIADEYVDKDFGTGCVKITPAHDFNDYEVGKRHNLEMLSILQLDGSVNENAPKAYQGLDRFTARKQVLQDLEAEDLLLEKKPHTLNVPRNDRGNNVLEPMLTDQWYVKMEPLAEPALTAVKNGDISFTATEWENTYCRWLENIQDWCISRQLWWGHRIPAWYDENGKIYVGESETAIRSQHPELGKLTQDEDVLDTWFSSALWPFSTLGWPEKTPSLEAFYPTSVMVTGFDILFFWVARMVMFGLYFTKQVPFKTIYIHGLVRDQDGQKMSKTKGNVLDPVDLIDGIDLDTLVQKRTRGMMQERLKEKAIKVTKKQFPDGISGYGTDALRFTFAALASVSRDVNFDVKRLEGYRNFCNKLWNAARFILLNLNEHPETETPMMDQGQVLQAEQGNASTTENIHQYFAARLNATAQAVETALQTYRFDLMASHLYEFVWNDFCDWYLEFCKVIINSPTFSLSEKDHAKRMLLSTFEQALRLLHPIIPFITEEIWQAVKGPLELTADTIINQAYPRFSQALQEPSWAFTPWLKELIVRVRTIRAERNVHPSKTLPLFIEGEADFGNNMMLPYLQSLVKIDQIEPMQAKHLKTAQRFTLDHNQKTATFYLGDVIDLASEKSRLEKEQTLLETELKRVHSKLKNPEFINKAPATIVEKEQQRQVDFETKLALIKTDLEQLEV